MYVSDDVINKVTVKKLLEYLSPEERMIMELRFTHDMCFREIGKVIGERRDPPETVAESTVRYIYSKIKTRLNRKFKSQI